MPADDPPDREVGTSEADQGSHFEPQGSKDRWHYGGGGLFFFAAPRIAPPTRLWYRARP